MSWSDTAGLLLAHLKKGQTVNTGSTQPADSQQHLNLSRDDYEIVTWNRGTNQQQYLNCAIHLFCACWAGHPKSMSLFQYDGVSGFICHNVQTDWWDISAHDSMNPSIGRNLTRHFSWRSSRIFLEMFFPPVWQKMPQWWYTHIRDMEEHTFVYFCIMTWT